MDIPDIYRHNVEGLVAQARILVERGEPLAARAFIAHTGRGEIVPLRLDDSSDESKVRSAHAIQLRAALLGADFIFILREAWRLPEKYLPRYDEIIEKYGSIGASPHAEDLVTFSLETPHGVWMAMPTLRPKPPSKTRRTFGPVTFRHIPDVHGRFVGLLPTAKAAPDAAA